jgi:hypothetical protein
LERTEVSFGGGGVFASFSFKYFTMPKRKKQERLKQRMEATTNLSPKEPSSDFLARFYGVESWMRWKGSTSNVERKHLQIPDGDETKADGRSSQSNMDGWNVEEFVLELHG